MRDLFLFRHYDQESSNAHRSWIDKEQERRIIFLARSQGGQITVRKTLLLHTKLETSRFQSKGEYLSTEYFDDNRLGYRSTLDIYESLI